jgi:hypothetical protein
MRLVLMLSAALAAAPVAAQPYRALQDAREADRVASDEAARLRDINITNELSRLQAQAQTNQGLADLQSMRAAPAAPTIVYNPNGPPPKLDASKFAQIPDAELADSNAKVKAASENRR